MSTIIGLSLFALMFFIAGYIVGETRAQAKKVVVEEKDPAN